MENTETVSVDELKKKIEDARLTRILTYRYIWKVKNNPNLNVKIISGVIYEHEDFQKKLRESEEVESAMCEYLHEMDLTFLMQVRTIKSNNKEDLKDG